MGVLRLRQKNTSHKVHFTGQFLFDDDILHCLLRVLSFYDIIQMARTPKIGRNFIKNFSCIPIYFPNLMYTWQCLSLTSKHKKFYGRVFNRLFLWRGSNFGPILSHRLGDWVGSGVGLSYQPPKLLYIGWRAGTTTRLQSQLHPPVRDSALALRARICQL